MSIFDRIQTSPQFVMLVGLPAAGKSTIVKEMVAMQPDAYVASTDAYVERRAEEQGTTYDALWADLIDEATADMHENLRKAYADERPVIVDRTNLTLKGRAKMLAPVPSNYIKSALYVPVDPKVQVERLASRPGKEIPGHVIANMRNTMVIPSLEEGFDMVMSV